MGSVSEIDEAMKAGAGHPMGPLTLADFVGLDTMGAICEVMFDEFRERRFAKPPTLRKMLAAGWYGRKTGQGLLRLLRRRAGGEPGHLAGAGQRRAELAAHGHRARRGAEARPRARRDDRRRRGRADPRWCSMLSGRFDDEWGAGHPPRLLGGGGLAVIAHGGDVAAAGRAPRRLAVGPVRRRLRARARRAQQPRRRARRRRGCSTPPAPSSGSGCCSPAWRLVRAAAGTRGSRPCSSALTLVVVIVAFVDWVFSPEEIDTFRWILLLIARRLRRVRAGHARPTEPHHAVG